MVCLCVCVFCEYEFSKVFNLDMDVKMTSGSALRDALLAFHSRVFMSVE